MLFRSITGARDDDKRLKLLHQMIPRIRERGRAGLAEWLPVVAAYTESGADRRQVLQLRDFSDAFNLSMPCTLV